MVFVPGNPETQTVSHSFPKLCAALQKKVQDRKEPKPGAKTLRRLGLVDDGRCWSCVNRLPRVAMRGAALRTSAYLSLKVAEPTVAPLIMMNLVVAAIGSVFIVGSKAVSHSFLKVCAVLQKC